MGFNKDENQLFEIKKSKIMPIPKHYNNSKIQCIQHKNQPHFICRNSQCLYQNRYMACQHQDCMNDHFNHPEDLISFQVFYDNLLSFEQIEIKNQQLMNVRIRETMNKLLHMRVSVIQCIDSEIQILKKRLSEPKQIPTIKDRIYLIKPNSASEIEFETNELEKQISIFLGKTISRLNRNVNTVMSKNIRIEEQQDQHTHKISYEFKIQGTILKIKQLLQTIPEHINKIKIYLNQDTYGQNSLLNQRVIFYCLQSLSACINNLYHRRIYKESYQELIQELSKYRWIKKIHLVLWDNFFEGEGKKDMLAQFRKKHTNICEFIVEDKMKPAIYKV